MLKCAVCDKEQEQKYFAAPEIAKKPHEAPRICTMCVLLGRRLEKGPAIVIKQHKKVTKNEPVVAVAVAAPPTGTGSSSTSTIQKQKAPPAAAAASGKKSSKKKKKSVDDDDEELLAAMEDGAASSSSPLSSLKASTAALCGNPSCKYFREPPPKERTMQPCPQCDSIVYCTVLCRRAHKKDHQRQCQRIQAEKRTSDRYNNNLYGPEAAATANKYSSSLSSSGSPGQLPASCKCCCCRGPLVDPVVCNPCSHVSCRDCMNAVMYGTQRQDVAASSKGGHKAVQRKKKIAPMELDLPCPGCGEQTSGHCPMPVQDRIAMCRVMVQCLPDHPAGWYNAAVATSAGSYVNAASELRQQQVGRRAHWETDGGVFRAPDGKQYRPLGLFKKALSCDPSFPRAWWKMGILLYNDHKGLSGATVSIDGLAGAKYTALQCLAQAVSLEPKMFVECWIQMAQFHELQSSGEDSALTMHSASKTFPVGGVSMTSLDMYAKGLCGAAAMGPWMEFNPNIRAKVVDGLIGMATHMIVLKRRCIQVELPAAVKNNATAGAAASHSSSSINSNPFGNGNNDGAAVGGGMVTWDEVLTAAVKLSGTSGNVWMQIGLLLLEHLPVQYFTATSNLSLTAPDLKSSSTKAGGSTKTIFIGAGTKVFVRHCLTRALELPLESRASGHAVLDDNTADDTLWGALTSIMARSDQEDLSVIIDYKKYTLFDVCAKLVKRGHQTLRALNNLGLAPQFRDRRGTTSVLSSSPWSGKKIKIRTSEPIRYKRVEDLPEPQVVTEKEASDAEAERIRAFTPVSINPFTGITSTSSGSTTSTGRGGGGRKKQRSTRKNGGGGGVKRRADGGSGGGGDDGWLTEPEGEENRDDNDDDVVPPLFGGCHQRPYCFIKYSSVYPQKAMPFFKRPE